MIEYTGLERNTMMAVRAAENVFMADTPPPTILECLKDIRYKPDKRSKAEAGLSIVSRFLPSDVKNIIKGKLRYTQENMPFDPKYYKLREKISHGFINDVFLLESLSGEPSFVLKVLIGQIGERKTENLIEAAARLKNDYEEVANKFKHIEDFVPSEHYIVANGPRRGRPVKYPI